MVPAHQLQAEVIQQEGVHTLLVHQTAEAHIARVLPPAEAIQAEVHHPVPVILVEAQAEVQVEEAIVQEVVLLAADDNYSQIINSKS